MTTPYEDFAAVLAGFGIEPQRSLDAPPEPTGPRAPKPDPSQGSSALGTPSSDAREHFAYSISYPARGDEGWRPIH